MNKLNHDSCLKQVKWTEDTSNTLISSTEKGNIFIHQLQNNQLSFHSCLNVSGPIYEIDTFYDQSDNKNYVLSSSKDQPVPHLLYLSIGSPVGHWERRNTDPVQMSEQCWGINHPHLFKSQQLRLDALNWALERHR